MSDLITRAIDSVNTDWSRSVDLLEEVGTNLGNTFAGNSTETLFASVSLTEGYGSRVGTDLLPPDLMTILDRNNVQLAGRATGSRQVCRPVKKPDTVYDGLFVGAGGQTFPANTPLNQIPAATPGNGRQPTETIIYVNGINTTKDGQAASLQAIADRTGARVIGIHNATEGIITDLGQCIADKLDKGTNPPVDTLAQTVYNEIKAGRSVHLLAHSQGGLITSRALTDVYQRLRIEDGLTRAQAERRLSLVKVETFGAAAGHYPDGPQYVHYINRDDPVPSLFGLGWDFDRHNPTLHAGRGAVVHWFTDIHLNPIASHSFEDVYLPRRVPFDQARRGNFN
jgi:hypothetical protein